MWYLRDWSTTGPSSTRQKVLVFQTISAHVNCWYDFLTHENVWHSYFPPNSHVRTSTHASTVCTWNGFPSLSAVTHQRNSRNTCFLQLKENTMWELRNRIKSLSYRCSSHEPTDILPPLVSEIFHSRARDKVMQSSRYAVHDIIVPYKFSYFDNMGLKYLDNFCDSHLFDFNGNNMNHDP
jgi:hypothetical protein